MAVTIMGRDMDWLTRGINRAVKSTHKALKGPGGKKDEEDEKKDETPFSPSKELEVIL